MTLTISYLMAMVLACEAATLENIPMNDAEGGMCAMSEINLMTTVADGDWDEYREWRVANDATFKEVYSN
jgi:hypothetical protein